MSINDIATVTFSIFTIVTCTGLITWMVATLISDALPTNRRCHDARCWGTEYKGHLHHRYALTLRGKLRNGRPSFSLVHAKES
jgi:hypothetical protein